MGPAKDGVQGGPQLVRHGGEQLILGAVESFRLLPSLLLAREQAGALLLDTPALRDVTGDLRGAHDASVRVPDGRHRDRHGTELSILGYANGLEVVDALTPPEPRQHLVFLRPSLGRDDEGDRLADRLRFRPAE